MQGTKIRLLTGGLLMMAAASYVQADALQPDPAWQQGTLANGFQWQGLFPSLIQITGATQTRRKSDAGVWLRKKNI